MGDGNVRREFLFADDLADACVFLLSIPKDEYWSKVNMHCSHVNIGCGEDITIRELADLIKAVVGFKGVQFDASKPDGTVRKLMDIGILYRIGWKASATLHQNCIASYDDFLKSLELT